MELLNDALKSVLSKFRFVNIDVEGCVEIDGRLIGPVEEITSDDLNLVVDAVKNHPRLLQNNALRLTIHEFASSIPNPDDAYKFMAALMQLKNKAGTRIYFVTPFGNFTSLHYQGLIQNAYIPEAETQKKEPVKAPTTQRALKMQAPVHSFTPAPTVPNPDEKKPRAGRKSTKTETKVPAKRTPRKRNK